MPAAAGIWFGGGRFNEAHGLRSVVAGGQNNVIEENATWGFIGGGWNNEVHGANSGVAAGRDHEAFGDNSFIGGGRFNRAHGEGATVAGGELNWANGEYAHVPGGYRNRAMGDYSMAAGKAAWALHDGSFVWSDSRGGLQDEFESTAEDQFLIAADGGVGINTNSPQALLDVAGDTRLGGDTEIAGQLLVDASVGIGTAAPAHPLDVDGTIRSENILTTGQGNFGSTVFVGSLGTTVGSEEVCRVPSTGRLAPCSSSSLRYKTEIEEIELGWAQVMSMRPVRYRFTADGKEDLGLIAEELAEIDPSLVVFDAEGRPDSIRYARLSVLLISAMQEREQWLQAMLSERAERDAELARRVDTLKRENAELRQIAAHNAELEERLARLESLLVGEDAQLAEAP